MTDLRFKTVEIAQLYEEIGCWSHPEHPFLDPNYSLESNAPAVDLTPFLTTWIATGREDAISELWGFLTYRQEASFSDFALRDALYVLQKVLKAQLPSGVQLSHTAQHELHAICILSLRAHYQDMSRVGKRLAATTLACRQMTLDPTFANELNRLVLSELRDEESDDFDSTNEFDETARLAVETVLSPLGMAESASERLKAVPPMARCVVYDYIRSGREGSLRFGLNYEDRMYGCGLESNQQYVDWLGFFGSPDDNGCVPFAVKKEILIDALKERGIECKPNATRKAMLEQARKIPGLLSGLISRHCPQQRQLLPQWKESVNDWARRVQRVELVAAALIKFMALSAMNEKGTANPFFHNQPIHAIFKTLSEVVSGSGHFAVQNSDPVRVYEFPALEFLRVYDREPPEKTWKTRWEAACAAANDDKASRVLIKTRRMAALKASSVWQELGDGAGGYEDTLGNPFPPFSFNSGMDVNEVARTEAVELGLI
jgi:hypothetical protein